MMPDSSASSSQNSPAPSRETTPGTCPVCEDIGTIVRDPLHSSISKSLVNAERIWLDGWEGFVERVWCKTCQQIVHHFETSGPPWEPMTMSCSLVLRNLEDAFILECEYESTGPWTDDHSHKRLKLIKPQVAASEGAHYISLDPKRIDINQLRGWLSKCDEHHHGMCPQQLDLQSEETAPVTFIDVNQSCLVSPTTSVKYVTLSYVWGDIPGTLMATLENWDHLNTPGSLEIPEIKARIPRTILDAIYFTKIIGVEYLWVDRLCIMQNSTRHVNEQIQQMASIYNKSHFTIIAANGEDANFGIRGIGGLSRDRDYQPVSFQFLDLQFLYQVNYHPREPKWLTRAWTFQEGSVSRRAFVFYDNTVYWQCKRCTWQEHLQDTNDSWRYPPLSVTAYPLTRFLSPDLKRYYYFAAAYNSRELTYEEDAIKAFSVIIDVFSRSFHGRFIFGIPELLFDIGLLWSPRNPLKRRKSFPSWSWVGWSGDMIFVTEKWSPILWGDSSQIRYKPIISWKIQQGGKNTRINNSYHIYQSMRDDSDCTLPQGWSQVEPGGMFRHEAISNNTYFHPFPLVSGPISHTHSLLSPLLKCQTKMCMLELGESIPWKAMSRRCLVIELKDQSGTRVGLIESGFTNESDYPQRQPCEVIVISEGFAKRRLTGGWQWFDEIDIFPELEDEDSYHFYNVLWIERIDSISYRKAAGRVMKDAWERQELQLVDITLG